MEQLTMKELIKLSPMEQTKHAAMLAGYQAAERGEGEPSDGLPYSAWSKWSKDGYALYHDEQKVTMTIDGDGVPTLESEIWFPTNQDGLTLVGGVEFKSYDGE